MRCDCGQCYGDCSNPAAPLAGIETEDGLCRDCANGVHFEEDDPYPWNETPDAFFEPEASRS